MTEISKTLAAITLSAVLPLICVGTANAATHHYVIANNNAFPTNTVSVYEVSGASLVPLPTVPTGGTGSGGGYFAGVTQAVAQDGTNSCVFVGDAGSMDISAMKMVTPSPYLKVVSNYASSEGDADIAGLGIIASSGYLYANYTGNTINGGSVNPALAVWKIGSGCKLGFVGQLANTSGLNGGAIDGMAVTPNGKYLVVAYGDGSVGSMPLVAVPSRSSTRKSSLATRLEPLKPKASRFLRTGGGQFLEILPSVVPSLMSLALDRMARSLRRSPTAELEAWAMA